MTDKAKVLDNPTFEKFWESAKNLEPSDQVIDAYLHGKLIGSQSKEIALVKEKLSSNVDKATTLLQQILSDLKKSDPTAEILLNISSPYDLVFNIVIEEKVYNDSKEWLFDKIIEIEDSFQTRTSNMVINVTRRNDNFNIELMECEGFHFSYKGA